MLNALLRVNIVLLLISGVAGLFQLAPPHSPPLAPAFVALLLYGPLLLMSLAAIRLHPRSLTWLCFLLLFYFCGFVTQSVEAPPARYWALLQIALSVVLFSLAIVKIRRTLRSPPPDQRPPALS